MSKQDRQGVRTARDIEQKYKLGAYEKKINEANKNVDTTRQDMQRIMEQMRQEFGRAVEEMDDIVSDAEDIAAEARSSADQAMQDAAEAKNTTEDIKTKYEEFDARLKNVEDKTTVLPTKDWVFNSIYPVGSIYLAYNHLDPGSLFPDTEWVRIENAFPWFTSAADTIGQTGGERTVILTEAQIPAHNHGGTYTGDGSAEKTSAWLASDGTDIAYDTVSTGGGEAHNNMPPYIQISAWRRIK